MRNPIIIVFVLIFSFSFLQMDCKTEPPVKPDPPKKEITLTLTDTTCTEAWLQLKFGNFIGPHSYKIYRDSTLAFAGTLFANETTFIDDGLLPKRMYQYKLQRFEDEAAKDSAIVIVTTMDTTSHEFEWEIHYFGDYGSNLLNDVAIIDENNIWAVGAINMFDSLGQRQDEQYGFVRWNGKEWSVLKIKALYNLGVQFEYSLLPQGIIAFAPNDIWFANGSVYHWNGDTITPYWVNKFPGNPIPIWKDRQYATTLGGTTSSNLYAAGPEGALGYFDGTSWKNVEINTNYNGHDIFVDVDQKTGKADIYGLFSNYTTFVDSKLFKLDKHIGIEVSLPGIQTEINNIWGIKNKSYYAGGLGLFVKRTLHDTTQWKNIQPFLTEYATHIVRGTGVNNVIAAGAYGEFLHFNGVTWKSYQTHPLLQNKLITAVDIHKQLVAICGWDGSKAFVLFGKQQ